MASKLRFFEYGDCEKALEYQQKSIEIREKILILPKLFRSLNNKISGNFLFGKIQGEFGIKLPDPYIYTVTPAHDRIHTQKKKPMDSSSA